VGNVGMPEPLLVERMVAAVVARSECAPNPSMFTPHARRVVLHHLVNPVRGDRSPTCPRAPWATGPFQTAASPLQARVESPILYAACWWECVRREIHAWVAGRVSRWASGE
jgi:hypothetical protein